MVLKLKNKTFIIAIIVATLLVIIYIFNLSLENKCVKDKELEGFSMNVHKAIGDIYAKSEQSRQIKNKVMLKR